MKHRRSFVLATSLLAGLGSFAQAQEVRIDFGSSSYKTASTSGKNWNNITSPWGGSTRLVNYSSGSVLPWSANITNGFEAVFSNGTTSATADAGALFGTNASRDSFVTAGQVDKGEITFTGLDSTKSYDFKMFGSVMTSRTINTTYSLKGSNLVSGTLNVGNNRSGVLALPSVKPTSSGVIRLTVDTASNNNSFLKLAFLNGLTMTAAAPPPPPPPPPPPVDVAKNLLFFGNSFTQINTMTGTLAEIAVADAHMRPYIVAETGDSRSLNDNINEINLNPAANVNNLPAGQKWDNVVMQEFSTGATTKLGDVTQFKADTKAIYNAVKTNSPGVKPVLYETWAYLGTDTNIYGPASYQYVDPIEMQTDIHNNYSAAATELEILTGTGKTLVAHVGDQWQKLSFAADLYGGYDTKHPSARGSLIAALTLYKTIYNENVSDIAWNKVESYLSVRQITQADWTQLTALVDSGGITLTGAGFMRAMSLTPEPMSLASLAMGAALLRRRR